MIPAERLVMAEPDEALTEARVNQLPAVANGSLVSMLTRENKLTLLQIQSGPR